MSNGPSSRSPSQIPTCIWYEPSLRVFAQLKSVVSDAGHDVVMASTLPEVLYALRRVRIPDYLVLRSDDEGQALRFTCAMTGVAKLRDKPVILYGELPDSPSVAMPSTVIPVAEPVQDPEQFLARLQRAVETVDRVQGRSTCPPAMDDQEEPLFAQPPRADGVEIALKLFGRIVEQVRDGALPGPIASRFLVEARQLANDERTTFDTLGAFAAKHQSAAARLIAAANSVYYRRSSNCRIDTVQQAVQRLGMRKGVALLEAVAMRDYLVGSDVKLRELVNDSLRRSLSTAMCAELLAQEYHKDDPDHHYAAGLFHNIGTTFFLYAAAVLKEKGKLHDVDYDALESTARRKGTIFNKILAEKLSLSKEIGELYGPNAIFENPTSPGALLHQAVWLAERVLIDPESVELDDSAIALQLTPEILAGLQPDLPNVAAVVRELHAGIN